MTHEGGQDLVVVENKGAVCIIRMNREGKKNALNRAMYRRMTDALKCADETSRTRVVLLYGGPACFTSGNDLKAFAAFADRPDERPAPAFLDTISKIRKPIIAAVNGVAVGIGCTMLLHCDLVFAGVSTRFQLPFINLGLCPEAASTYLLPRLAGHRIASELLFLGERFNPDMALEIGLINKVLPDEAVFAYALSVADKLVAKPFESILLTKSLLKRGQERMVAETLIEEGRCFSKRLTSADFKNAFEAFCRR